jgi:hypothetical protein
MKFICIRRYPSNGTTSYSYRSYDYGSKSEATIFKISFSRVMVTITDSNFESLNMSAKGHNVYTFYNILTEELNYR